jgi:hypothetical protein
MTGMIDSTTLEPSNVWNHLKIPEDLDPNIIWKSIDSVIEPRRFFPLLRVVISSAYLENPDFMSPISLKNFHLIRINHQNLDTENNDWPLLSFVFNINTIEGGLLNLLKIPNLHHVMFQFRKMHNLRGEDKPGSFPPVANALDIINKHLKNKNILACQRDLLKAGLTEYAKF